MTVGIKLGTQPYGAVEDPGTIAVDDIRWFREGSPGKLHKRPVKRAHKVKVTKVIPGYILVDYI